MLIAAVGLVTSPGCAPDLDTTRESVDQGTFGQTLVTLICKRMAYVDDLNDGDNRVDVSGSEYREVCRNGAQPPADAPGEIQAIQAQRVELAAAIDLMWPEPLLDDVQAYATSPEFLAVYDDGTITAAVLALRDMLLELAPRSDMAAAFERLSQRPGYIPESDGVLASLLSAPQLPDVLLHTSGELAPGGGAHAALVLSAKGAALELKNLENADVTDPERFGRLASDFLLAERVEFGTETPLVVVARDHRGVAEIAKPDGVTLPAPFVDSDGDGLADADDFGRYVDASGAEIVVPTPLPDKDEPDPEGTVRDDLGRVVADEASGALLYRYIDLDRTVLGNALVDAGPLLDPAQHIGLDLIRGLPPLLGARAEVTRSYDNGESFTYQGFDSDSSAALDLAHAGLSALRDPGIDGTLGMAETLMRDHTSETAQLIEAVIDVLGIPDDLGELGDRASLEGDSALLDDLVPVLQRLLETPGLLEDLMVALEDPRVKQLGPYFRDYMKFADQFDYDVDDPNLPVVYTGTKEVATEFRTEVDRGQLDSGFNRSIFQRVLHLLADTNGKELCTKDGAQFIVDGSSFGPEYSGRCSVLQIPDLAVFYVQSLTYARDANGEFFVRLKNIDPTINDKVCDNSAGENGTGTLEPIRKGRLVFDWIDGSQAGDILDAAANDELLELALEIPGFSHCPSPQALNRLLFLNPPPEALASLIETPTNHFEDELAALHAGSLPGWELGEFYDLIQPLAQPFADHDAEKIFVDLLTVLHNHWPSRDSADHQQDDPDGRAYAYASNVVSFEPIVVEALDRGLVFDALAETAPALNALTVDGTPTADILRGAGTYLLTPREDLTTRAGATSVTRPNGAAATPLAPWMLLAESLSASLDTIDADGERGVAFGDAVWNAVDIFARAEPNPDFDPDAPVDPDADPIPAWQFVNPRLRGIALAGIDLLRARIAAHDLAADRDLWLSQELPADLEDLLTNPLVAGSSDLITALDQNPMARAALEGMIFHALDRERDPAAFAAMTATLADAGQLVLLDDGDIVPIGSALGDVLDPDRGWLDPVLALTGATGQADTGGVLATTIRNLVATNADGDLVVSDVIDGVCEVHRARPFDDLGQPLATDDYEAVFRSVAGFLEDEQRGLLKFVAIIQGRNLLRFQ